MIERVYLVTLRRASDGDDKHTRALIADNFDNAIAAAKEYCDAINKELEDLYLHREITGITLEWEGVIR